MDGDMTIRILYRLFPIFLVLAAGCSPPAMTPLSNHFLRTIDSPISHGPVRYTREYLAALQRHEEKPLIFPLNKGWDVTVGDTKFADGVLEFRSRGPIMQIAQDVSFNSGRFNTIDIRMRVNAGEICRLYWTSGARPRETNVLSTMKFIAPDGRFHTYRFDLRQESLWTGNITSLRFSPTDLRAAGAIESFTLLHIPPEAPKRVVIRSRTYEAVPGNLPHWDLTVPPEAKFEVQAGILERAWESDSGARFIVTLEEEDGESVVLADELLLPFSQRSDRGWQSLHADLHAYNGKRVQIRFRVDPVGSPEFDFAYWGNPIVYRQTPDRERPNIFFISCDTVRADHLSVYGYHRKTTPNLEAFAKDAVIFDNAITSKTWTLPSHISMFTGFYPKNHRTEGRVPLSEDFETLGDVLSNAGYLAGAFTGLGIWLDPTYGLGQGFDLYDVPKNALRSVFETCATARHWLDDHPGVPKFVFMHNYDAHPKSTQSSFVLPYGPEDRERIHFAKALTEPASFTRHSKELPRAVALLRAVNAGEVTLTDAEHAILEALYDDAILSIDAALGDFFGYLRQRNLYDSSLIIITSDHGEELFEHGKYGHRTVYEECARVPLLIKLPGGVRGRTRVEDVVELVDIYPTILDIAGLAAPNDIDGRSLLPLALGQGHSDGIAYSSRFSAVAIRTDEWKFIMNNDTNIEEAYNLSSDPLEHQNLVQERPELRAELAPKLKAFFATDPAGWHVLWNSNGSGADACITISADDRILKAFSLTPDEENWNKIRVKDGRIIDLNTAGRSRVELLIKTASSTGRITLEVVSDSPFLVIDGAGEPFTTLAYSAILDPVEIAFPSRAMPTAPGGDPQITLWRVPDEHSSGTTRPMDDEEKAALEALGYVN